MTKTNTTVSLPFGLRKEISKELNVSEVTVWSAITGRSNSALAKQIRLFAKEKLQLTINSMDNLDTLKDL